MDLDSSRLEIAEYDSEGGGESLWNSEYDTWNSATRSGEHESSRARSISTVASQMVFTEEGVERRCTKTICGGKARCGERCTGNVVVLILSIVLFTTITSIQFIAALTVGSKALMADCASMLIDALSYCGNLLAECMKRSKWAQPLELVVSGVSIVMLVSLTLLVVVQVSRSVCRAHA